MTTLKSRYYYCTKFINEETEARKIERLAQDHPVCRWWSQDSNPVSHTAEPLLIITAFQCLSCWITPHLNQYEPIHTLKSCEPRYFLFGGTTPLSFQTFVIKKRLTCDSPEEGIQPARGPGLEKASMGGHI